MDPAGDLSGYEVVENPETCSVEKNPQFAAYRIGYKTWNQLEFQICI